MPRTYETSPLPGEAGRARYGRSGRIGHGDSLRRAGGWLVAAGSAGRNSLGGSGCEYRLAVQSRDALQGFLASGAIVIQRQGQDAYGRTLARVTVNGRDAGEYLIANGLARRWR